MGPVARVKTVLLWPLLAVLGLAGCDLSTDTGSAEPGNVWPWVCPDGAPAPDAGCLPIPSGPDAGEAGADTSR